VVRTGESVGGEKRQNFNDVVGMGKGSGEGKI